MNDKIMRIKFVGGELSYNEGRINPFWKEESKTYTGGDSLGGTSNLWYKQEREDETIEINSKHVILVSYWDVA